MSATSRLWSRIDPNERQIVERYMRDIPVKLGSLAKELGIDVKLSSLPQNISGQISKTPQGYEIKINRHESKRRQRFTLAHEIAHFLLHKPIIDSLGGSLRDNVLYRSGASEQCEYEANRLASQIIMPESALRVARSRYGYRIGEHEIETLANEFGVSKAAMEIRVAA